jgi:hypothetical protein
MAGGLATTTTIVRADFWRLGQCRPGDKVQFKRITWNSALELRQRTEKFIHQIQQFVNGSIAESDLEPLNIDLPGEWDETILHEIPADEVKGTVHVKFRQVRRSNSAVSLYIAVRLINRFCRLAIVTFTSLTVL